MPNNKFNRKSLNLGFNYNLSEKLSFGGNINYSREINTNPPNIANQDNSIPTTIMGLANTMPLSVLEANKYNAAGNEYIYSRFMNRTNPYWVLAEQFHNIKRTAFLEMCLPNTIYFPGFLFRAVLARITGAGMKM